MRALPLAKYTAVRGKWTNWLQNVHFRAFASVDPWHRLRSHRSTAATGGEHTASDAVCSPPVGPLLRLERPEAQRWQAEGWQALLLINSQLRAD